MKYILDLRDFPGDPYENKVIHDFNTILQDDSVTIICETMGGVGAAYQFTKQALELGKSVCTSNKELVAKHGPELLQIAREHNCNYLFEASVEGHDACRKIAILSSLMFGKNVDSEKIPTEGITKITAADFEYANATEHTIKLLGRSRAIDDDTAEVMVAPFMLPKDHPLAMVYGVFNAVFVTGNMLGDSMYYGRGAGKLPTASAVVSDVIDCARHQGKVIMCFWDKEEVKLVDTGESVRSFFIRAKTGAEEAVEAAFPGGKELHLEDRKEDFGYFTQPMKESEFLAKYEALGEQMLGRIRLV